MNFNNSCHENLREVRLAPGDFYFSQSKGQTRIYTLLGSCVGIVLWHPTKLIGGMCHYLLAKRGNNTRWSQGHYADDVAQLFAHAIKDSGTLATEYQAKIFGGGTMFENSSYSNESLDVSKRNIDAGIALVKQLGIELKSIDVGGVRHRKIYFELWSGDVWLQYGG